MKTTLPSKITTKEQAIAFLTDLYKNDESFHPEDDANDLSGDLFTKEEGDKLNQLMEDIYNLDGNNGNHHTPKFDPCYVLLALDKLIDLNNLNLLHDVLNGTIEQKEYCGYLEKNNHTRDWELSVSNGEGIVGTYLYSRWGDVKKDIAMLQEFEILIEEE